LRRQRWLQTPERAYRSATEADPRLTNAMRLSIKGIAAGLHVRV
jgi:hypothetical protein